MKGASESDNKQVIGGALNKFYQTVKIMTNFEEEKSERQMPRGWKLNKGAEKEHWIKIALI